MTDSQSARAPWGFVFVALAAILFGSIGVTSKGIFAVADTNAYSITQWRALIALPVIAVAGALVLRRRFIAIAWRDLRLMIAAGLLMALYQVAFVLAVQLINVTIATLVTLCTVPVFAAVLSTLLIGERPHPNVGLAMACAIVGVVLLVGLQPIENLGSNVGLGIVLALLTALTNALFQISGRVLANRYHPLQTLSVFFLVVVISLFPLALLNGFQTSYPLTGWLLLIHLGLGISVFGYGFLMLGLRTTSATVATIIGLLEPLTGTILAVILFNEQLSGLGLVGAALLLAAMVIVYRTNTAVRELNPGLSD